MVNDAIVHFMRKLSHEIDAADLYAALEQNEAMVIVDARQRSGYMQEHIPGAINFPHREMNEQSLGALDRQKTYIAYCTGIGCNASTKGALKLAKAGFKVKELIGGLEWWKLEGYPTEGGSNDHRPVECGC